MPEGVCHLLTPVNATPTIRPRSPTVATIAGYSHHVVVIPRRGFRQRRKACHGAYALIIAIKLEAVIHEVKKIGSYQQIILEDNDPITCFEHSRDPIDDGIGQTLVRDRFHDLHGSEPRIPDLIDCDVSHLMYSFKGSTRLGAIAKNP